MNHTRFLRRIRRVPSSDSSTDHPRCCRTTACARQSSERSTGRAFVNTLMEGNGSVAEGPFPSYFAFGDSKVQEESYDLEYSRELLAEAGWTDEDGDGYVEKDGKRLTICWLTYPSRQELPLLAESAQASLKKIGIEVQIQCTANHLELLKKGNWDVYVSAFVSAPTGDPEYFLYNALPAGFL